MRFLRYFLMSLIIAALTAPTGIALADFLQTVPGSGTTFAASVIGAKQYLNHLICDATVGQTQCATVNASGQIATTTVATGPAASGAALSGSPVRIGISDTTNVQNWLSASGITDANTGVGAAAIGNMSYNGATWDRVRGDITNGLWVNCKSGCSSSTSITSWGGGTLGAMANYGSTPGAVLVPGVNAFVTNSNANGAAADAASSPVTLSTTMATALGTPSTRAVTIQGGAGMTPVQVTNTASGPYPIGAVPYTASATGTTGATTATLANAATGITTYICGFSIRANATAAVTGNATVTGTISGTLNFTQWTAPTASGLGVTEEVFVPCVPATGINTPIAVVSGAPGTGGVISVTAWGFKL